MSKIGSMSLYYSVGMLIIQYAHSSTVERKLAQLDNVLTAFDNVKDQVDSKLFLYQTPDMQWVPSTVYRYEDFRESLDVMATEGVAGKTFYVGEDVGANGYVYGLINIAAFLAQSMKETIQYDACDENSWDMIGGKYPLSNACGQLGQSYQDYHCSPEEAHMECKVDPNMSIKGVTNSKWYGAPGPMFCGPKTDEQPFSGYWDHTYECSKSWATPPETCSVYEGQKAGQYDQSAPFANNAGRTDVEGCCWWGRGVIQTSGICNFGKLNYFLGAGASEDGRYSRYPTVDFCKDPEVICADSQHKELKWIAGEFYWMESVQTYNQGGWDYTTELRKFVDEGMTGNAFIDAVSGIVNRGCHNPPCGTGALDGGMDRAQNFQKVLDVLFSDAPPPPPENGVPSSNTAESDVDSTTTTSTIATTTTTFATMTTTSTATTAIPAPTFNSGTESTVPGFSVSSDTAPESAPGSDCETTPDGYSPKIGTQCKQYVYCQGGLVTATMDCPSGLLFNGMSMNCDWSDNVDCFDTPATPATAGTYVCGGAKYLPLDSMVVDVSYDYEASVADSSQAKALLLRNVKDQVINTLKEDLDCDFFTDGTLRRRNEAQELLGFMSIEGSDMIKHEGNLNIAGSCNELILSIQESCVPVVGHVGAIIRKGSSPEAILAAKNSILASVQDGISSSKFALLTQRIVYVDKDMGKPSSLGGSKGSKSGPESKGSKGKGSKTGHETKPKLVPHLDHEGKPSSGGSIETMFFSMSMSQLTPGTQARIYKIDDEEANAHEKKQHEDEWSSTSQFVDSATFDLQIKPNSNVNIIGGIVLLALGLVTIVLLLKGQYVVRSEPQFLSTQLRDISEIVMEEVVESIISFTAKPCQDCGSEDQVKGVEGMIEKSD